MDKIKKLNVSNADNSTLNALSETFTQLADVKDANSTVSGFCILLVEQKTFAFINQKAHSPTLYIVGRAENFCVYQLKNESFFVNICFEWITPELKALRSARHKNFHSAKKEFSNGLIDFFETFSNESKWSICLIKFCLSTTRFFKPTGGK